MIQYIAQSECANRAGKVEFVTECICSVGNGTITVFPVKCSRRGDLVRCVTFHAATVQIRYRRSAA